MKPIVEFGLHAFRPIANVVTLAIDTSFNLVQQGQTNSSIFESVCARNLSRYLLLYRERDTLKVDDRRVTKTCVETWYQVQDSCILLPSNVWL